MKPKQAAMLKALQKTLGNVTEASKMVGISRDVHYRWMHDSEEYKDAVENINEEALDFVESQLFRNIANGDRTCIIFYLKTRGRKRGYIERHEVEVEGDTEFSVKFGE